jgi:hypothetical protein
MRRTSSRGMRTFILFLVVRVFNVLGSARYTIRQAILYCQFPRKCTTSQGVRKRFQLPRLLSPAPPFSSAGIARSVECRLVRSPQPVRGTRRPINNETLQQAQRKMPVDGPFKTKAELGLHLASAGYGSRWCTPPGNTTCNRGRAWDSARGTSASKQGLLGV